MGRIRLLLRHDNTPAGGSGANVVSFGSLAGASEIVLSAMGAGWTSDPSPMTAICPDSGSGVFSLLFEGSLDQKAQVEPALGGGLCAGGASGGGTSFVGTSSALAADSSSIFDFLLEDRDTVAAEPFEGSFLSGVILPDGAVDFAAVSCFEDASVS